MLYFYKAYTIVWCKQKYKILTQGPKAHQDHSLQFFYYIYIHRQSFEYQKAPVKRTYNTKHLAKPCI